MDRAELRTIIDGGETFTVEFKRATPRNALNDQDLVEAVVCMANGAGGKILLGVEDDGRLTGIAHRHEGRTDPDRVAALILNKTDPPVATTVSLVALEGFEIVVIEVPRATIPVGTKTGVFKRRSLKIDGTPECIPYRPHDLMSAAFSLAGRDYAETVVPGATIHDLDPLEFDRFRRLASEGQGDPVLRNASDDDLCRALRVTGDDDRSITLGAILLFGRQDALARFVPSAECLFQEVAGGRIVANESLRSPLLRAAETLYGYIAPRNPQEELLLGMFRVGVHRVPLRAVRESIANALVHRDYAEIGPVLVQLGLEEFKVTSPGGFPPGVSLANLMDVSRPRSMILADAFKRAGLVDRAGRGIHEMYEAMLRAGRGGPDYTRSTEHSVTVVIPTSGTDLDMVRFIVAYENEHQSALTLNQMRVLHEIKATGTASITELVEELHLSPQIVRPVCSRLVELGLIEVRGTGRGRRFHLTAAFYRLAEDRNAYVRVKAADPIQQEHMIMSYVEAYGSITRSQAASLCMLTSVQARSVLQRMVAAGRLRMRGQRRTADYVAVEAE